MTTNTSLPQRLAVLAATVLTLAAFTTSSLAALLPATAHAATTPMKLMPLGDSITDGFVVPGGYRTQLWQRLDQTEGDNIDFVGSLNSGPSTLGDKDHEGHTGWCMDGTCNASDLTSIIDARLATYKPDAILLHGGTNDINDGDTGTDTATHLDTLLGKIFTDEPNVAVVVAKIIPMYVGKDAAWSDYNSAIPGLVAKYQQQGRNIQMLDMSTLLSQANGDYTDNLHPSQQGYNKMADAWYPLVTSLYNAFVGTPPPPSCSALTGASFVQNFETDQSGWTGLYGSKVGLTRTQTAACDGTWSLQVKNTGTTAQDTGVGNKPQWIASTTAGTTYTASAWAKGMAGQTAYLLVQECTAAGSCGIGFAAPPVTLGADWTQLTTTYRAVASGHVLKLWVYQKSLVAGGTFLIDQTSLNDGSVPAPAPTPAPLPTPDPIPIPVPSSCAPVNNAMFTQSFESDQAGWTAMYGKPSFARIQTDACDGTWSLQVGNSTTAAADTGVGNKGVWVNNTLAGTTYTADAWVKGAAGQQAYLVIQECTTSGTCGAGYAGVPITLGSDWTQLNTAYKAASSGHMLKLWVYIKALPAGGSFLVDQTSLTND